MELNLPDLRDGYITVVEHVSAQGEYVKVRDQMTRELTNVTLIFDDTTQPMLPVRVGRGVNQKLAAIEALTQIGRAHV